MRNRPDNRSGTGLRMFFGSTTKILISIASNGMPCEKGIFITFPESVVLGRPVAVPPKEDEPVDFLYGFRSRPRRLGDS